MGKAFNKDYFVTISPIEPIVIICKNPDTSPRTYEELMDITLRYTYKVGDKILTSFGIQTIKDIDKKYGESLPKHHGYEWLILVEENGNQYKPCELIGIVVKTIPIEQFNSIIE